MKKIVTLKLKDTSELNTKVTYYIRMTILYEKIDELKQEELQ